MVPNHSKRYAETQALERKIASALWRASDLDRLYQEADIHLPRGVAVHDTELPALDFLW